MLPDEQTHQKHTKTTPSKYWACHVYWTSSLSGWLCEPPLGSRCPQPSRDTCRQSTCTNVCTKKLLSLWLHPQPHLQCYWVGCGKEISLCRVWTGNHCSGFKSPTLGFVDLSLDHISSQVNLSVCASPVEEWRCDSILHFSLLSVCVLLPLSTGVPPFNLKAWDWEKRCACEIPPEPDE